MPELIYTSGGEPFKTESAAKMMATTRLTRDGQIMEVVPVEGGYALKEKPERRPKRKPIGTQNVLKYPPRKGFIRRVVNDKEDRVRMFEAAGYSIVTEDGVSPGEKRTGDPSQMG